MIFRYTCKAVTWIDLECPTHEEVLKVMKEFNVHPLVGQELVGPSLRPKVELYPDFIYLILHFPVMLRKHFKHSAEQREIDFIVGKNFIVTTRYDAVDALHQFSKVFEVSSILDRGNMGEHAGFVFFYMIRSLYDSLLHEMEALSDAVRSIENHIFKGKERAMVVRISEVGRELLDAKRALRLHKEILESFEMASGRFFGEEFKYHAHFIIGEYYKAHNALEDNIESVAELRETNNSLLNTRETETMKRISILVFLTLPATLITNIFATTANNAPIVGHPLDWYIFMFLIICSTIFLFVMAKWRKWF